ncbi:MAG: hypothetical protein JHC33_13805 [Ignisphaera sp.]|nr:hypothetical protein [Ignisphaera sp.]
MGATTLSLLNLGNSDAQFRAWGSAVDGTFTTFGWIRTSDTGQVNWATVTYASSTNQSLGYSVFRMNDSLQGSYPVFLKIEYGNGLSSNCAPGLWVTIGTGSDGSGTITGILKTRTQLATSNALSGTNPCYFSGGTDRYCCVLWPASSSSNSYLTLSIERTKNSSGATTGDGILFLSAVWATALVVGSAYLPFSSTIPSTYAAWNCNVPTTVSTGTYGAYKNTVAVYPIKCWTPGESGPSSNIFLYQPSDITPLGGTIQLTLFDSALTGTYLPLSFAAPSSCFTTVTTNRGNSGANVSLLMRYE